MEVQISRLRIIDHSGNVDLEYLYDNLSLTVNNVFKNILY